MLLDWEKLHNILLGKLLDSLFRDFREVLELSIDHSELFELARLSLLSGKTGFLLVIVFNHDRRFLVSSPGWNLLPATGKIVRLLLRLVLLLSGVVLPCGSGLLAGLGLAEELGFAASEVDLVVGLARTI